MPRLDWDRLRRTLPLDGADPHVDPDGAVLWERELGPARDNEARPPRPNADPITGLQKLRAGIVVRRVRERREADAGTSESSATPPSPRNAAPLDPSAWIQCPRCHACVPRKKVLLHARASCTRKG